MYFPFRTFFALACAQFLIHGSSADESDESVRIPPPNSDTTDLKTLRLVQVIFRHGDRTPVVQYPKDPLQDESLWPEGFSALTKKGKKMQLDLGKYLRARYDGFLSRAYKPLEISVQSSSADRAIMSALANLAGLFPPTEEDPKSMWDEDIKWQPIPVHTLTDADDNYINFKAYCPRFKELKEEYIRRSEFAIGVNSDPANQELYSFLSNHTGWDVKDFEQVSDLHDTLLIQSNYHLPLPNWTHEVFPERTGKLFDLPFDTRVQVPTEEVQKVKCGPLLRRLVTNMDAARDSSSGSGKPNKAKMYMYSGHDSTSSILLGTLKVFDTQFPAYASTVLLEMHELPDRNNNSDYYLKVFFRNSTTVPPFELNIPSCGYPCRLDTLKESYKNIMVDGPEWRAACEKAS
ncbi:unnamed protein product [Allacma fusca]|uniref:acid phosphatase n=1 Tax=Allacma fusca TaxID=39272 RepID=A0A8J2LRZ9_9HEXA|nr:unnamed protein product [Allacma fusca]